MMQNEIELGCILDKVFRYKSIKLLAVNFREKYMNERNELTKRYHKNATVQKHSQDNQSSLKVSVTEK